VALLDRSDGEHERCQSALANLRLPFVTTWPVLTEAAWLLRADAQHVVRLLQLVAEGHVEMVHMDIKAAKWIADFYLKYADQTPQLADASLMYLAERLNIDSVFTLDRRDFSIYRTSAGKALQIVPE
jgi:hypothetical protein